MQKRALGRLVASQIGQMVLFKVPPISLTEILSVNVVTPGRIGTSNACHILKLSLQMGYFSDTRHCISLKSAN